MKPKLLLRIASIVILIHILGHLKGHSGWKQPKDPAIQEVVKQMLEHKAPFMGSTRSMADYYEGYSLCITATLIMMMVITWWVSASAALYPSIIAKVLLPISYCLLAFAITEFTFFFAFAASISLIASILIGISALQLNKMARATYVQPG